MQNIFDMIPMSSYIAPVPFNIVNIFLATYNEHFIKTISIHDLMSGYKFPIYDLVDVALIKPLEFIDKTLIKLPIPPERLPKSKFGILHVKNLTNRGGLYGIYTGKNTGPRKFLRFYSYRGKT